MCSSNQLIINSILLLFTLITIPTLILCNDNNNINVDNTPPQQSTNNNIWKFTTRLWQECSNTVGDETATNCLQTKLVSAVDRASRSDYIPIWDSIAIIKTPTTTAGQPSSPPLPHRADFGRAISEYELVEARKNGRLQDILWDRMARFLSSHTVKIDLPKITSDELKNGVEEGRGKMKKMMSMMMMGGAMKAMTLIPLALGVLFILAGKALIVAKIALVLSLLMTIKKLMSAKQDDPWQSGPPGHGGWDKRSLDMAAHDLAYSAHKV